MVSRVGVNLRASAYLHQGDRKYMEDEFVVAYQRTTDKQDIEYAFFGIFDGHGGKEAAHFAKDHLMDNIVNQTSFWSDDDYDVLEAIREGFIQTHLAMWKVLEKWPRTASGWPSTSGSTASVAFIRKQKIYIGHVGDSGICLGYEGPDGQWLGTSLTEDHKPESTKEKSRISRCGGKVVTKSGVPRVVWNRPKPGHKGPVRRSTPMDEIPFLAVARSLGDLWSYNPTSNQFVVSPIPDVHVHPIDIKKHRCLIFGTDGLWNVMSPLAAVSIAYYTEKNNENHYLGVVLPCGKQRLWVNPSRSVVKGALDRYNFLSLRADNTSAVVVFLDPPGRPKREVLLQRKGMSSNSASAASSGDVTTVPTSQPSTPGTSKDSTARVRVHVYNLENNSNEENGASTSGGTSKLAQKTPVPIGVYKCKEKVTPQLLKKDDAKSKNPVDEQAATPGSVLCRSVSTPVSSNTLPLRSSSGIASPATGIANMSHHCDPSPIPSSLRASSLRSNLESSSPANRLLHLRRMQHSTAAGTSSNTPSSEAVKDPMSQVVTPQNRLHKRERDEDEASGQTKKQCCECSCAAPHIKTIVNSDSQSSYGSSSVTSNNNACSNCNKTISSSPKLSAKFGKASTSSIGASAAPQTNKKDDIQIPVVSSSTVVSSSKVSTTLDDRKSKPSSIFKTKSKSRPTLFRPSHSSNKHLKFGSRAATGKVCKLKFKTRTLSDDRKTRSGLIMGSATPKHLSESLAHSASPVNISKTGGSSSWNSDGENRNQLTRTSARTVSGEVSSPVSRVLKNVNRGSTPLIVNKNESSSCSHKTAKLANKDGKKKQSILSLKTSIASSSLGTPSASPIETSSNSNKKKFSKVMLLRSDKPMITRSQEKTCKGSSRPK